RARARDRGGLALPGGRARRRRPGVQRRRLLRAARARPDLRPGLRRGRPARARPALPPPAARALRAPLDARVGARAPRRAVAPPRARGGPLRARRRRVGAARAAPPALGPAEQARALPPPALRGDGVARGVRAPPHRRAARADPPR